MLFFVLLLTIDAAKPACDATHSNFYLKHWSERNRAMFWKYGTEYGAGDENPCEQLTNAQFRAMLQRDRYDFNSSWHVEHIVDINNGPAELANYPKHIRANMIIAYGSWNIGVGQLCWPDVAAEKSTVYGAKIFNNAMDYVKKCGSDVNHNLMIAAVVVSIILIIGAVIGVIAVYRKNSEPSYGLIDDTDGL